MPRQHRSDETRVQRLALGNVGRRALGAFAGRFTVSLTSSLVCGADLFLLLVQVIASLVSPAASLFTRLACPLSHIVWDFSRDLANALTHLISGLGSIEDSHRCADAQPRQKPQETTAVSFRHDCLLTKTPRVRMLAPTLQNYNPPEGRFG